MRIALDYDGTFTADPALWKTFLVLCRNKQHEVWIVTMRYPEEKVDLDIPVLYTSRKAKKDYCDSKELYFDIWIDDQPEFLFNTPITVITDLEGV